MDTRIVELALEELNRRENAIETEIAELESELSSSRHGSWRSTAGKSQSQRMKEYWAQRRANSAKLSASAPGKRRPKTAVEKKALSKRMKTYWAKRKAAAQKRA